MFISVYGKNVFVYYHVNLSFVLFPSSSHMIFEQQIVTNVQKKEPAGSKILRNPRKRARCLPIEDVNAKNNYCWKARVTGLSVANLSLSVHYVGSNAKRIFLVVLWLH
jgi:hypothetical protein